MIGYRVKKRMFYQILKLLMIMWFGVFGRSGTGSFPVPYFLKCLAAIVLQPAVIDKKFSGDRFSLIRE